MFVKNADKWISRILNLACRHFSSHNQIIASTMQQAFAKEGRSIKQRHPQEMFVPISGSQDTRSTKRTEVLKNPCRNSSKPQKFTLAVLIFFADEGLFACRFSVKLGFIQAVLDGITYLPFHLDGFSGFSGFSQYG